MDHSLKDYPDWLQKIYLLTQMKQCSQCNSKNGFENGLIEGAKDFIQGKGYMGVSGDILFHYYDCHGISPEALIVILNNVVFSHAAR